MGNPYIRPPPKIGPSLQVVALLKKELVMPSSSCASTKEAGTCRHLEFFGFQSQNTIPNRPPLSATGLFPTVSFRFGSSARFAASDVGPPEEARISQTDVT